MSRIYPAIVAVFVIAGVAACEAKQEIQEKIQTYFEDEDGGTRLENRVWLPKTIQHISQVVLGSGDDVWLVTSDESLYRVRPQKPAEKVQIRRHSKSSDVSWVMLAGDQLWVIVSSKGRNVAGLWDLDKQEFRPLIMEQEPSELVWAQGALWISTTTGQLLAYRNGALALQELAPLIGLAGGGSSLMARERKGDRLLVRHAATGTWRPGHDFGGEPVGLGPNNQGVQRVTREPTGDKKEPTSRLVMGGETLIGGALKGAAVDGQRAVVVRATPNGLVLEWRSIER